MEIKKRAIRVWVRLILALGRVKTHGHAHIFININYLYLSLIHSSSFDCAVHGTGGFFFPGRRVNPKHACGDPSTVAAVELWIGNPVRVAYCKMPIPADCLGVIELKGNEVR